MKMLLFLAAWLGIALCSLGESLDEGFGPAPAAEAGAFRLIQRKPYDRGNCFHWPGCRGESIGAMWVHAPEFCAALGGRSWLDESTGRCYDLRPGALWAFRELYDWLCHSLRLKTKFRLIFKQRHIAAQNTTNLLGFIAAIG